MKTILLVLLLFCATLLAQERPSKDCLKVDIIGLNEIMFATDSMNFDRCKTNT